MDHRAGPAGVPAVSGRLTTTDRTPDFLRRVRALSGGQKVRVGILADAPKKSDPVKGSASKRARTQSKVAKKLSAAASTTKTLLEIALIHEFGGGHVPARSFIRATMDERAADITKLQVAVARLVLSGKLTPAQALEQIGAKVASMVQARIVAGIAPPLAASTRRQKARSGGAKDTPLIRTGQLRSAITYAVVGNA